MNINNLEGKVKIKFVFTIYFLPTNICNFGYAWTSLRWGKQDCGNLLKMATQFNMNTNQEQWTIPENI